MLPRAYSSALVAKSRLRRMLEAGDKVPEATVWLAPREPMPVGELAADVPILLFFYLFDWSST
jgi:hypothetical protein